MKKILLITALITFAFSHEIFACQCVSNPPFLTAIKNENTKTIAKVKVRRYLTYFDHPHGNTYVTSMEVEVEEIYKGKQERKKVTIWGTEGSNCLEYLAELAIDKVYVVGLFQRGNTEYNLSNCGEFWLTVKNGIAVGRVAEGQGSISLEELKKEITKAENQDNFLTAYQFYFPSILGNFSLFQIQ